MVLKLKTVANVFSWLNSTANNLGTKTKKITRQHDT